MGKYVQDCFAIVGENGAGKTMLVRFIMDDIRVIREGTKVLNDFILIKENEGDNNLSIYYTDRLEKFQIKEQEGIAYQLYKIYMTGGTRELYLKEYEIAYFCNALNRYDYFAQLPKCRYDFSFGQMISQHHRKTFEMNYDSLHKDVIQNYYDQEAFRIITFLYDHTLENRLEMKFPLPKEIQIGIADERYSEKYIMYEAKELGAVKKGEVSEEEINRFSDNVNNIVKIFGKTWINCTVKNLILNCYKELCIQASTNSLSES